MSLCKEEHKRRLVFLKFAFIPGSVSVADEAVFIPPIGPYHPVNAAASVCVKIKQSACHFLYKEQKHFAFAADIMYDRL